ncbi:hypothetical protein M0812_01575 [Anaeramoeba flamelloides]|uniref:GOST seven transmembrane domain-containing protein n=1 Tax=Anaeramoeba flamelloides TaxID=1746091 RepID=A0AAV7Z2Y1_9EUKA|nr:hypothetical protein M0812_01575 [Anaeramoeba flamelloides]
MRLGILLLITFTILLLSKPTHAIIGDLSFVTSTKVIAYDFYGFEKGGTIESSVDFSPEMSKIFYLVCTKDEYTNLVTRSEDNICADLTNNDLNCNTTIQLDSSGDEIKLTSNKNDIFLFLMANCERDATIDYTIEYTYLNPDGEHLSTVYQPLPKIYLAFFIIFLVMMFGWFINWVKHRDQKIGLHKVLTIIMVFKIITFLLWFLLWSDYSKQGKPSNIYIAITYIVSGILQLMFYMALLYIAKGWSILRPKLKSDERASILLVVLILVISIQIQTLFGSGTVVFLFFFVMAIAYFAILRMLFVSTAKNVDGLLIQMLLVREAGINPKTTPFYSKYHLFLNFKKYILIYIILSIFVALTGLFLTYYPYLTILFSSIVDLIFYCGIGWTFKLQSYNELFDQPETTEQEIPQEYLEEEYRPDFGEATKGDKLKQWEKGMALPHYEIYQPVIAIENVGETGTYAIGETVTNQNPDVEKKHSYSSGGGGGSD